MMDSELQHIQIDEFVSHTREILQEVERRGESVLIENGDQVFALIPKKAENRRKKAHLSRSDGLFEIIGIGESEAPTDIAAHKHEYIADSILDHQNI
jgi:hypothetical protein